MKNSELFENINPGLSIEVRPAILIRHAPFWSEQKTKSDPVIWNIIRGNMIIEIDGRQYPASEGEAVIFYPKTKYTASTDGNGCEFIYNRFSLKLGNKINLLEEIDISGVIPSEYISSKCRAFCKEAAARHLSRHAASFEFYVLFLSYLSDIINIAKNNDYPHFPASLRSHGEACLHTIMVYMNDHFNEDISMKELAQMAHLSEKHFSTAFRRTLGISPKQYMIQRRMEAAAKLLLNTNDTVASIAALIGYGDVYSFSKAFKKYYEDSPVDFRKSHHL